MPGSWPKSSFPLAMNTWWWIFSGTLMMREAAAKNTSMCPLATTPWMNTDGCCLVRTGFPSAKDGQGFKPLADYVHSLGLKFGIHMMRGIPRAAAHSHLPVLGTETTANEIADPVSICDWNPDMYGVKDCPESQAYYDSIFELYASWGRGFYKMR